MVVTLIRKLILWGWLLASFGVLVDVRNTLRDKAAHQHRLLSLGAWNRELEVGRRDNQVDAAKPKPLPRKRVGHEAGQ